MSIEIREIKAEDTYPIRHEVMWPDKNIDFVKIDDDTEGVHFGLFDDGVLVSIVSLFLKKDAVQFRKFATLIAYQGRGYGTKLLNYVFQYFENQGVKKIWCNARSEKKAFYQKLGMVETGVPFTKNGLSYLVMFKHNF